MLQLALDFVDERIALKVAKRCSPYIDILEAGTPLIKESGIGIVRKLKRFGLPVLADLKTFDVGYLEARLAAENGADYATVMAATDDRTIEEFVKGCKEHGIKSVADMMACPLKRAVFLERTRIGYICVHSGIDQQKEGKKPFEDLKRVAKMVKAPLMVAGGIKRADIAQACGYADIIVIGSTITKAGNPSAVAKDIREVYAKIKGRLVT